MKELLCVQRVVAAYEEFSDAEFATWVEAALRSPLTGELTIRLVDVAEMTTLNETYRHKVGPTNVLSFPYAATHSSEVLMGDVILCMPVIVAEAMAQKKTLREHLAHLVVHGVLHLQGYDHIAEADARVMQGLEEEILQSLGFSNPYLLT